MAKRTNIRLSNVLPKRIQARPLTRLVAKIGRNEPCPCGSGKKYKDCHQSEGETYLVELAMARERAERRGDGEGTKISWLQRLFGRS
jgi:SEC-C motif